MRRHRSNFLCFLSILAASLLAGVGCERQETAYEASTPDDVLDSAQQMILNGDADRLTDLVYAEDENIRSFFNQVGSMLGALQDLGQAVETRFPEELSAFRAEAEAAAAEGKSNPILGRLVAAGRRGRGNQSFGVSQINRDGLTLDTGEPKSSAKPSDMFTGRRSDSQREIVNGIIKQLLADPYRWLAQGRDKIDHVYIADDTVSLTWEGRPLLPPFGLSLIEREGRWFLVPPTSYPGVRLVMPRNADEWFIWGSMVKTLERVVVDLTSDVRSGSVRNMTDLADSAAEKVAIPAMLVFFAYSKMMDERQAEARAAALPEGEPSVNDDEGATPSDAETETLPKP